MPNLEVWLCADTLVTTLMLVLINSSVTAHILLMMLGFTLEDPRRTLEMRPEFHVDILTLLVVAVGVIGTWYTQKATLKWHTSWIKKHDAECDEQRRMNNTILIELRTSN